MLSVRFRVLLRFRMRPICFGCCVDELTRLLTFDPTAAVLGVKDELCPVRLPLLDATALRIPIGFI